MKFFIDNWTILSIACISGAMLLWPLMRGGGAGGVTAGAAVQLINRSRAVVIDVRTAEAFATGHMGAAKHVPLTELEARLPALVKNKALPLVLVGERTEAAKALLIAKKLGYEQAQILTGGLKSWRDANLPVVT